MIDHCESFTNVRALVSSVRGIRATVAAGLLALLVACGGGGGYGGDSVLPPSTAPSITVQPQPQTAVTDDTVTFNVVASGTGPLTYQWNRGLLAIPGATGSSYTTPPLTLTDSGVAFSVTVTNAAGLKISDVALLTVNANPAGIYSGTFTPDAADADAPLPMLAIVLKDGTVAAFVTLKTFTTNVPIGVALADVSIKPSRELFGSAFKAYTQAGFMLDDGTTSFSGTISGNILPGTAILGSIESPLVSGDFRLNALTNDYARTASAATIAGTYQHSYVTRDVNSVDILIDATTTYDANGAGTGSDTAGCSVSSTAVVPDAARNAYTIVSNSTCPGNVQSTFNGLMTLFPAGTGAAVNGGVDFSTDTLISIAHDGASGYMVVARK